MLKLLGTYIPFVLVILAIGACSLIYKDDLSVDLENPFNRTQEEVTVVVEEEQPAPIEQIAPIVEEQPNAVEMETSEGQLSAGTLPGIGECICPDTFK